jgi:oxygen-dependent protoporphyrinogen oxidase
LADDLPASGAGAIDPGRERVIVVGGGVAGLVLARRLALGGRDVTMVEASDHLGGTVSRHTVGGIDLDAGAESFATRGGTVGRLAKSLGLADDLVEPNPVGAWLQTAAGAAFQLPANSLLGIPGVPLAADVIAIVGTRAALRGSLDVLMPGTYASKAGTVGELVRKRMGSVILDQLVRPIIRGVHSADADELKVDQVAPGLLSTMVRTGSLGHAVLELRANSARAGSAVAGIRGGVVRLVDALAADLARFGVTVLLNSRATEIAYDHVVVGGQRLDGQVVVAAPGLSRGLGGPVEAATTRGHRVVLATLVVDQPLLDAAPRGTGVLVAEGTSGIRARALTHSTAKWAWLAERAGGKHVLRLSYDAGNTGNASDTGNAGNTGDADDDAAVAGIAGGDPTELAEIARLDAAALLGVEIAPSQVIDFARAAWYRPSRETHTPDGILAVGESIAGTGLASVVAQSEALAERLLADADGSPGLR